MSNTKSIPLTGTELGFLWTGYSINEMSKWYLMVFLEQVKNKAMKEVFSIALQTADELLLKREKILRDEGYSIPIGFSESDINAKGPSLYTDRFLLHYLHCGSRLGIEFHSRSFALATRENVRNYHKDCLNASLHIHEKVVDLLLNEGIYWRDPSIPSPTNPEFVQKTSYLNGWFGDTRPINSMEMANLYLIIDLLNMMEALFVGFAQTSESKETIELIQKGITVVKKQYVSLAELLKEDELPIPPSYSAEVTNSKERVFSDRIMVSHIAGLFGSLISQYGFSLGTVMNHDLLADYLTQISKAGAHTEKLTRYLIEKEWLEKVPEVIDRKHL